MAETDNGTGQRPALLLIDDDMNYCAAVSRALHKSGASYYLAKPVNADDIVAAFGRRSGDDSVPIADKPPQR